MYCKNFRWMIKGNWHLATCLHLQHIDCVRDGVSIVDYSCVPHMPQFKYIRTSFL